jgi:hypothetical protein
MKAVKNLIVQASNWKLVRIDPNVMLFLMLIAFFALLLATENIIKHTLIPQ